MTSDSAQYLWVETLLIGMLINADTVRPTETYMKSREIHEILTEFGLKPNKRLGQNFLVDEQASAKIVDRAVVAGANVLEIGPGLGSLTEYLIQKDIDLTLVEIDAGYASFLKKRFSQYERLTIIHSDVLKLQSIPKCTHVVSNLPYYCASEILFRIMEVFPQRITVMVQKEMAARIAAKPGTPSYGALTLNLGLLYSVDETFDVGKNSFYPRPDVDSTVVVFNLRKDPVVEHKDLALFKEVVRTLFWGRRKTVLKCLVSSPHITLSREAALQVLQDAGIDSSERGENLDQQEYANIVTSMKKLGAI